MPNTFLLENMRCPKCGNAEVFKIDCTVFLTIYDDHIVPPDLPVDACWDKDNYCQCEKCSYNGEVRDFYKENQNG